MKAEVYMENIRKLLAQRNTSLLFAVGLLISNLLLGTKLLFHSEKVIVVPPEVRREFWIDGGIASSSYLEQMSLYFVKQMLDMTPESAGGARNILLRHVSPTYYSSLSKKLLEQEKYLKDNSITTIFFPKSVKADAKNQVVEVIGQIKQMVGNDLVKEEQSTYRLKFEYNGVRFLINSFGKVEK